MSFDITKHKFKDSDELAAEIFIDGLCISHSCGVEALYLFKEDAAAIATHFGLIEKKEKDKPLNQ